MIYLKLFNNHSEYEEYKASQDYITPNVSGCKTEGDAHFDFGITVPVTGVSLDKAAIELNNGETETLVATVMPLNASTKTVVWETSDSTVATVTNGVVSGVSSGSATITVTTVDGGYTAQCSVEVTESHIDVTAVTISSTAQTITKGNTYTLTATVLPADATDKSVTWSTSDSTVATVDNGVVTAVGCGEAVITVTTHDGGRTAQCTTTIENPVTGVTLNESTISLLTGATTTLVATITPADACGDKTITWATSDGSVATVSSEGVVTAVGCGSANITATVNGITASCSATITNPVTGITLNKYVVYISTGETCELVATTLPVDACGDKSVTWTTSDSSVVTVTNGVLSGVSSGSAVITATTTVGSYTATCSVEVSNEHDYSKDYLTFNVLTGGTIMWSSYNNLTKTISYSKDNGETWIEITSSNNGTPINVNAGDKVLFKGNNTAYASTINYNSCFGSGGTAYYSVEGNIMSLIGGDNFTGLTSFSTNFVFYRLFFHSKAVSAENLIMPVTTLTDSCYRAMFGFSPLTKAPALPGTTLGQNTYWYTFEECPLTEAPELPATTLANSCYGGMFYKCTSLTTAPVLSADTLVYECYINMFNGCSNLNYIKCLATDGFNSTNCKTNWVNGVASSGTFVKSSSVTTQDWSVGNSGIPTNWVVRDDDYIEVTSVTISSTAETIDKNDTVTLTATVLPNDATDKSVTWSTSNSNVATVVNGVVTGVGCGTATITVTTTDGSYTAQCTTTVENHVTGVDINTHSLTVNSGSTSQLVAIISPNDACNKGVSWSSSNSSIATVDSNGIVSGVTTGSATITVSTVDGGYTAQCSVSVTAPSFTSMIIEGASAVSAETCGYRAICDNTNDVTSSATWSITAGSQYATINSSNGEITILNGANQSSVTIQAVYDGLTATTTVTLTYLAGASSETTSEITTDASGNTTSVVTTVTEYQDGSSTEVVESVKTDENGDVIGSSQGTTNTAADGSYVGTTTNYDASGNPVDGSNVSGETNGNVETQGVEYDASGNSTVVSYTVDTSENPDGKKVLNGNEVDTDFYAFDLTRPFELMIHFKFDPSDGQVNQATVLNAKRADPSPWYGFDIRRDASNARLQYGYCGTDGTTNRNTITKTSDNIYKFKITYDPTVANGQTAFTLYNMLTSTNLYTSTQKMPDDATLKYIDITVGCAVTSSGQPQRRAKMEVYEFYVRKL